MKRGFDAAWRADRRAGGREHLVWCGSARGKIPIDSIVLVSCFDGHRGTGKAKSGDCGKAGMQHEREREREYELHNHKEHNQCMYGGVFFLQRCVFFLCRGKG